MVSPHPSARSPREPLILEQSRLPVLVRLLLTLFSIPMCTALLVGAAYIGRRVTLDCSRAAGTCVVTDRYLGIPHAEPPIPLDSLTGSHVGSARAKGGLAYWLVLDSRGGAIDIDGIGETHALRASQQKAFDTFLHTPTEATLHVDYDKGSVLALFAFPFIAILTLFTWFSWQRARVRFVWAGHRVVFEQTVWPFRTRKRHFSLDKIGGARVVETPGPKETSIYTVVLIRPDGHDVPRTSMSVGGRAESEAAVARISTGLPPLRG